MLKKTSRLFILILVAIITLGANIAPAFAVSDEGPKVNAKSVFIMDAKTGKVMYEKAADKRRAPASTTKIMTAILVVENLDFKKEITVGKNPPKEKGNVIGLKEGEILTVEELFYGLMLWSGNDAAVALAEEISGSVKEFSKLMNKRAKELGATNTNFNSANGMPTDDHYSTARDIGLISQYAIKNPVISKVVKTKKYTIPATNKSEEREIINTNKLLYSSKEVEINGEKRPLKYEGITGLKTGMTLAAGYCLVATAQREDTEIIGVILKSDNDIQRFKDGISALDFGFENYRTLEIFAPGEEVAKVKVKKGSTPKVWVTTKEGAYITLPSEGADELAGSKVVLDQVKAPAKEGQVVGKLEILLEDQKVDQVDLILSKDVPVGGPWTLIGISDKVAYTIMVVVPILLFVFFMVMLSRRKKNLKKLKRQKERRQREIIEKAKERLEQEEDRKRREWPF